MRAVGPSPRRPWFQVDADVAVMAAALSFSASIIHAVATLPHFEVALIYGAFFVAMTLSQSAWSAWVLRGATTRAIWWIGATLNITIVLVWLLSRTVGIPIGPEPWTPERVGLVDVVAGIFELGTAALAMVLIRRRALPNRMTTRALSPAAWSMLTSLIWLTTGALVVGGGGHR